MENRNNEPGQANSQSNLAKEEKVDQPLPIHNPLDPNDQRQITQEDIENEQKYKEALTERD